MTTGDLDIFAGIDDNQPSLRNVDAFRKVFESLDSKLNLKRKQNTQLNQIEAKKAKKSVK